jgi:uncharacterized RDD family membrane protein YckC
MRINALCNQKSSHIVGTCVIVHQECAGTRIAMYGCMLRRIMRQQIEKVREFMVSQQYLDRTANGLSVRWVRPAGFWLRAFAYVYDGSAVGAITGAFYLCIFLLIGAEGVRALALSSAARMNGATSILMVLLAVAPFLIWLGYHVLFECSSVGATPGKLILGIRVVDRSGERASVEQTIRRTLWKQAALLGTVALVIIALGLSAVGLFPLVAILTPFLATAIAVVGVGGYLMAGVTIGRRALHDVMSDCVVVIVEDYPRALRTMFAIFAVIVVGVMVELRGATKGFSHLATVRDTVAAVISKVR